jgi:hypothetical protein
VQEVLLHACIVVQYTAHTVSVQEVFFNLCWKNFSMSDLTLSFSYYFVN